MERNSRNNPLNIRYNPKNEWLGQIVDSDNPDQFCCFVNYDYGIRAAYVLLRNYIKCKKLYSIRDIISCWAPPLENPTDEYVKFVLHQMYLHWQKEDDPDFTSFTPIFKGLSDNELRSALFCLIFAMSIFERGIDVPLSVNYINRVICTFGF